MFALLSDLESLDPRCTAEDKFKQLELLSNLLETENYLIEHFLGKKEWKLCQSDADKSATKRDNNQFANLQRIIDIADKLCMAISDEVEQLEIKSSDKLRSLIPRNLNWIYRVKKCRRYEVPSNKNSKQMSRPIDANVRTI